MRTNTRISIKLIIRVLVLLVIMASVGACNSGEPVAITCPSGMMPAASQRICVEGLCGNGVLDEDEECDDGNLIDGDGCSADCRSSEVCGNAIVDHAVGELCDDGNVSSGDECCGDCRSCPELAAPRATNEVAVNIEPMAPIAPVPLDEEEPCPSEIAVERLPEPARYRPAPLIVTPRAPAPLDVPFVEETGEIVSLCAMEELEETRAAAESAQQQARSEVRARRRLLEAQTLLNEELMRAHDTIFQLEQINADLHEYIAGDCQRLPSGRSMALY